MTQSKRPQRRPFLPEAHSFASGGTSTPRDFLEACLSDLERWEPQVGAFTALSLERARLSADASTRRWREGKPLSAIDGMPVGIKDIIDTADMPTEMGSPLYEGYVPRFDSASVQALRHAGAVIVGKTVTTEFASSEPRGTRNPWDLSRTPGGSSSGSAAAVAAGMLAGALGTQVVGSIIRPSGFCGVYGFKPSVGGLNRGGSLDYLSQSCAGTIAASLADSWIMARAIAERVGGDPGYPGLAGPLTPPGPRRPMRLGLLRTSGWSKLQPLARTALEAALDRLAAEDVEILTPESCTELQELEAAVADAQALTLDINAWEWRWPLGSLIARDAQKVSASAHERDARGKELTREDYVAALHRRAAARARYATLAARCDALVSVTAPGPAPVGLGYTGDPVFVVPGSLLGVPVVTLPALTADELPLGLQLLGYSGEDATLFGHAAWVEGVLGAGAPAN